MFLAFFSSFFFLWVAKFVLFYTLYLSRTYIHKFRTPKLNVSFLESSWIESVVYLIIIIAGLSKENEWLFNFSSDSTEASQW